MKKKDIIVMNYMGRHGAGPIIARESARAFVERGERVVAVISGDIDDLDGWKKIELEELIIIDTLKKTPIPRIGSLFEMIIRIKRIEKEYCIKLVYCPMTTPFLTQLIGKIVNSKQKCYVIHDPIHHSGEKKFIILYDKLIGNHMYKKADFLITHSKKYIRYIEKKYYKQGRVLCIPLGPLPYKSKSGSDVLYSSDKINFLFFGRIEEYKGLDILVRAFDLLNKSYSNITLTIVGNGDMTLYEESIKNNSEVRIINEWISDDKVGGFFTGSNIVLVLPYKDATQSGPALIAYQYGVPVIATRTGGLQNQVFDKKTGVLVEPNSVHSLVDGMRYFVENTNAFIDMKENIKKYCAKVSWTTSMKKVLEFTNSI